MHAAYKEFILDLPHRSIAGITWGPSDGKRILAIHGWLDNAASFIPLIPYLQNYKVIAIDLLGHGHSSHFPHGSYLHFIDYIADIIRIIDHLEWDNCNLLGHSLGAGIATIVAGTIPKQIESLILLDGIGAVTIPANELPQQLNTSIHEYLNESNKRPPHYANLNEAIQARLKASKMQVSSVELLVLRGSKTTKEGLTWRTDPRLLFTPLVLPTEEQLLAFITKVQAPTCLIKPDAGYPFDETIMLKRIGALTNVETHNVKGMHHVHMDAPQTIGPIIQEFLSKHYK